VAERPPFGAVLTELSSARALAGPGPRPADPERRYGHRPPDPHVAPVTGELARIRRQISGPGSRRLARDTDLPPASDTDLPPASDTDLRPASDTDLRPASDTDLRPASDTDLRPASDTDLC
jgi:hypothetical protein